MTATCRAFSRSLVFFFSRLCIMCKFSLMKLKTTGGLTSRWVKPHSPSTKSLKFLENGWKCSYLHCTQNDLHKRYQNAAIKIFLTFLDASLIVPLCGYYFPIHCRDSVSTVQPCCVQIISSSNWPHARTTPLKAVLISDWFLSAQLPDLLFYFWLLFLRAWCSKSCQCPQSAFFSAAKHSLGKKNVASKHV